MLQEVLGYDLLFDGLLLGLSIGNLVPVKGAFPMPFKVLGRPAGDQFPFAGSKLRDSAPDYSAHVNLFWFDWHKSLHCSGLIER